MTDSAQPPTPHFGDMPPEEFRRFGRQVVDWIADHMAALERQPVLPDVRPGDIARSLPAAPPPASEPMERILADFERIIMPGMTQWNHPNFFAYFAISGGGPGVLAEMLSAALNNNAMLWKSGPAPTELETVTLGWLRQTLGLPDDFWGIIYDTASISTMHAIACARQRALPHARETGIAGRQSLPMRIYASEYVHSSIDKSAITLGLGAEGVRKIPVDAEFRMKPDALADAIAEDRENGFLPLCVIPVIGTTSCASVDPISRIADICERESLWMHIDAAYAGPAAMLDECRPLFAGWERADSIVINPHKWLFVPFDLSVLYTRRPATLKNAFSLVPEYLKTSEGDSVANQMDYGLQLGRRFRSLKLWFVMRYFGVDGLRARLREHLALTTLFADLVRAHPTFELTAPPMFSLTCFRHRPPNVTDEKVLESLNARLVRSVNAEREIFVEHTKLRDAYTLRFAIGNLHTSETHVRRAFDILSAHAARLSA
jgi:aromatic-L-amino-acid decarboxylase